MKPEASIKNRNKLVKIIESCDTYRQLEMTATICSRFISIVLKETNSEALQFELINPIRRALKQRIHQLHVLEGAMR